MGHISVNHLLDKQEASQVPSDLEETMADLAATTTTTAAITIPEQRGAR